MKRVIPVLLWFFLCLFSALTGHTQSALLFEGLTTSKGLSNNSITCILQDHKGFIWFGTQNGLNRYDGYKFRTFHFDPNDTNSLCNDVITTLKEDKRGRLWIGTLTGLNVYDAEKGSFQNFNKEMAGLLTAASVRITAISIQENGRIWIGTENNGLISYHPDTQQFTTYGKVSGFNSSQITAICPGNEEDMWIGTNKGLNRIEVQEGKILRIFSYLHQEAQPASLSNNMVNTIYKDNSLQIWIGTSSGLNKLHHLSKDGKEAGFIAFRKDHNGCNLSHNDIKSIVQDNKGDLWIGTRGGGINRTSGSGSTGQLSFIHYQNLPHNPNSLIQDEVFSIMQDHSGLIWAGTYNGVSKITIPSNDFKHYQSDPLRSNSLINNNVAAILSLVRANEEYVFLGTSGGMAYMNSVNYHKGFENFATVPDQDNDLQNQKTQCLFLYEPDILWIGTKNKLRVYNLKLKQFISPPKGLTKIPEGTIRKIHRDRTGLIWIGANCGLYTWDPANNKLTHPFIQQTDSINKNETKYFFEPSTVNNVFAIEEDNDGNIWIGTWGAGLIRFNAGQPESTPTYYVHEPGNDSSLTSNYVTALHWQPNDLLWIGTTGGLNRIFLRDIKKNDRKKVRFLHFNRKDGLNSPHISGILEDDRKRLWLATTTGIAQFDPSTGRILNYRFPFGNITKENYTMGMAKDASGYLYFGGMSGLICFHPDSIKYDPQQYPLVLTDLQVLGKEKKPFFPSRNPEFTTVKEDPVPSITLTYKEYTFSFSFAYLNYAISGKTSYAYTLEGIDKDWLYRDASQRFASYSNLSPGTYLLKVKATDAYGNWTIPHILLRLQVLTPFWKAWWAFLIYAVLLSLILYGLLKFILSKERIRHNLKLERLEKEKVKEMEKLKLQYFTDISHEFRTPLTLIAGPLEELHMQLDAEKDKKVHKNLNLIHHNVNHLLRLINQLLDFRKAEDNRMKLTVYQGDLIRFVTDICHTFRPLANKRNIRLELNPAEGHFMVCCDWDKLEKILNNLVYNAIGFSKDAGTIRLEVGIEEGMEKKKFIHLEVSDDGMGISKQEQDKIFEAFYQAANHSSASHMGYGIGLSLTKKLVDLHRGNISVRSEPGKGTTFSIKLPATADQYLKSEIRKGDTSVGGDKNNLLSSYYFEDPQEEESDKLLVSRPPLQTLLIVDDNEAIRNYLRTLFENDYLVREASEGAEGLMKAAEYEPDLIISDVLMPGMDGNDFCKSLKGTITTCHIPVIMLTALDSTEHLIEGLETGADAYINKPFHPKVLKVRVRKLIELRAALRKKFRNEALTQPKEVTVNSADESFLCRAMEVIEAHITDDYTVDDFVRDMNMGRSVLYRKLKQLTDQSPNEFIRTVRLKRAAQLLDQQTGNISEVCYLVGFTDPGYFTKCFKKQFGKTPREFMETRQLEKQQRSD